MGLYSDNGLSPADLAVITDGNNRGNNGFFGGDGLYAIIVLFILMAMIGNGSFGGFGGGFGGGGGMYPWLNLGQNNIDSGVQRGFDQSAVMNGLNGINGAVTSGFAGVNQALCSGFAGVNATVNSGFAGAEAAANARQIANMQQAFAAQTAIDSRLDNIVMNQQNCCCENRAAIADLKYTVANENCQDRYEAANNTRDIIQSQTAGTQAILDKLCALELDGVRAQLAAAERENLGLQNQLNMATMQANQTAQTAQILAGQAAEIDGVYNRLKNCPVGTYSVCNPVAPVNYGCGCGA